MPRAFLITNRRYSDKHCHFTPTTTIDGHNGQCNASHYSLSPGKNYTENYNTILTSSSPQEQCHNQTTDDGHHHKTDDGDSDSGCSVSTEARMDMSSECGFACNDTFSFLLELMTHCPRKGSCKEFLETPFGQNAIRQLQFTDTAPVYSQDYTSLEDFSHIQTSQVSPIPSPSLSQTSDDVHICIDCGKRYSTSSNLARHRQTHRSTNDKKARKCPHCNKVYVSMPAYSMHVRTHNQGCECRYCGKKFSRPWLLQGHIRTHTGEKPFSCPKCGKAFADKSNLRAHVQTHSTEKPYECERCGKAFALKSYLYKHEESSCMRGQRLRHLSLDRRHSDKEGSAVLA